MLIKTPSISIEEGEGFTPEKDIFGRKKFGEKLANFVESSNEELVIALEAPWGEGKSTFIKMWKGYIENERDTPYHCIYFDAFSNDYQKDPFFSLAGEIYGLFDEGSKKKFREKTASVLKSMLRGAAKIGVKAGTSGLLDESIFESVRGDTSKVVSDQFDSIVSERLESNTKDKLALTNFRKYLQETISNLNNSNPIVFVIDELDRCRPDFALELIEKIKHLFSVKGIVFLLVVNRRQLESSVKARYGSEIDASLYMQKFINIWLNLPRKNEPHDDFGVKYFNHSLNIMKVDSEVIGNNVSVSLLEELIRYKKPSFREIENILSYFSIIHNMTSGDSYYKYYQYIIGFMCYLKAANPSFFDKVANSEAEFDEIKAELEFDKLGFDNEYYEIQYLIEIIEFDIGDDDARKRLIGENKIYIEGGRNFQNILVCIGGWLKNIDKSR